MDRIDHKNASDEIPMKSIAGCFLITLFAAWYGSHLNGAVFAFYIAITTFGSCALLLLCAFKFKWITQEKMDVWNQPDNMKKIVSSIKFTLALMSMLAAIGLTILSFRYAYLLYIQLPEQNVEYLLKGVACMSATAAFLEYAKLHMYGTKDNVNCKQKIKIGAAGAIVCLLTLLFI